MATAVFGFIAAAGAIYGAVQQRKIGKTQRRQNKLSNKIASIARRRNVKRSIASARIQVGLQQALGFQLGVSGGTAVQGGTAGVISDTASGVGFSNLQFTGQEFNAQFQDDISRFQGQQALGGAVANIAGGLASNPQATAALTNLVT
jgi:hypothetical protein